MCEVLGSSQRWGRGTGKEEQLAETQITGAVQGGGGGGGEQSQRLKPRSNLPGKQGARRLDTQQPPSLEALPRSSQPPAVRVEVTPRPKLPGQLHGRRKLLQAGGWAGSAKWPARLPWPQRQREGLRRGREQGPQEGPQPLVGPREAQAVPDGQELRDVGGQAAFQEDMQVQFYPGAGPGPCVRTPGLFSCLSLNFVCSVGGAPQLS